MDYRTKQNLSDIYKASGYHGADVANSIRSGNVPNQQDAIQELINVLGRY
jgi:hypothetical protein